MFSSRTVVTRQEAVSAGTTFSTALTIAPRACTCSLRCEALLTSEVFANLTPAGLTTSRVRRLTHSEEAVTFVQPLSRSNLGRGVHLLAGDQRALPHHHPAAVEHLREGVVVLVEEGVLGLRLDQES